MRSLPVPDALKGWNENRFLVFQGLQLKVEGAGLGVAVS